MEPKTETTEATQAFQEAVLTSPHNRVVRQRGLRAFQRHCLLRDAPDPAHAATRDLVRACATAVCATDKA